ncbi:MAG: hypothetical protein Q4B04_05635 [bacterium]|nr:hypothetical protein [bacterium]
MFFVLDTNTKTRKIHINRITIAEDMFYYLIKTRQKNGLPNWKKIRRKIEKLSNIPSPIMLTPENVAAPTWTQPVDCDSLFETVVLEHLINKLKSEKTKKSMGVVDLENRYIPQVQRLSVAAISVTVVSAAPEKYSRAFEQFADRYGTYPIITDSLTALKNCNTVIVTGTQTGQLLTGGKLLFTNPKYLDPRQFFVEQINESGFPPQINRLKILFAIRKYYNVAISVRNIFLT